MTVSTCIPSVMFNSTLHAFAFLLLLQPMVLAVSKAYVELVNGTPYDWHLISNETHHTKWFPNATIPSGTQATFYSSCPVPSSNKLLQVPALNPVSHGFYIYGTQRQKQHIVSIILHPLNPSPFEPIEIQPKSRLSIMKTSPLSTIPKIQSST